MKAEAGELALDVTGLGAARAALSAAAFALAVPALPELEDVGLVALVAGGAAGFLFLIGALLGAAWAFDAPGLEAARRRAARVREGTALSALVFCAAVLTQFPLVAEGWRRWASLAAPALAWLAWLDAPWGWAARLAERLRGPAPGPERYDTRGTAVGAETARAPELPAGVEALLVGSGAFKVDRARMLAVLSRFQTGDPEAFLLPWLRLAVASGARRVELSVRANGLELQFDGVALERRFLEDPYAALLDEDAGDGESQRHRHLAYGLLHLLPLAPRAVVGLSGPEGGRVRLLVEPAGVPKKHWVDPEPRLGTALRVVFDGWDADIRAARCVERARRAWGLADAELCVDGKPVPAWEPRPGVGTRFEAVGARGVFYRSEDAASFRAAEVYWLGALVGLENATVLPLGWACRLTYDGLAVDASLTKVARNAAFAALHESVRAAFDRLEGQGGLKSGLLRSLAYTKGGLASALGGGVLSFAVFMAAGSARDDLAWAAGAVYAAVSLAALGLVARWTVARLSGRRNPFRG